MSDGQGRDSKPGTPRPCRVQTLTEASGIILGLRNHWNALRARDEIPLRSDIDPSGMGRLREHCFILERLVPQIARFRLAGQQIADVLGMEPRGMAVNALFERSQRPRVGALVESVFTQPQIVELQLTAADGIRRPALQARMLLLPLRSDFGDVSRALGAIALIGKADLAPQRFGISAVHLYPTTPGATTRSPAMRDDPATRRSKSKATAPASPNRVVTIAPSLRVIAGGKA